MAARRGPLAAQIAHEMERPDESIEEIEAYYGEQYRANLY